MNILLTLRQPLLPADTGGKVRSLNILSRLATCASIHAISFADPVNEASSIAEMKHLFASYTPVFWSETPKYTPKFYGEILASQFGSWPYFLAKCNQPSFSAAVRDLAGRHRFDLLFCDFLHTAAPLLNFEFTPRIVFQHNVEFLLRKRKAAVETRALRKFVFESEWKKTRAIESKVCQRFDHVLAVSADDRQTMRQEFGVNHVSVLPTGVDTEFFKPDGGKSIPGRLAFVGSMDWDPNEDGVSWFLNEVYPRIRQSQANVSLSVIGRNPSARLRTLAAKYPGVQITGTVPDVRPYLSEAEAVIVPLRIGGGTRIKIPEAMAMEKAVVSTTIGAEGLPFRPGKEICVADKPEDFANTTIALLQDQALRDSIAASARKTVAADYSWDAVVLHLEDVLDRMLFHHEQTDTRKANSRLSWTWT